MSLQVWRKQDDDAQVLHLPHLHGSAAAVSGTQQVSSTTSQCNQCSLASSGPAPSPHGTSSLFSKLFPPAWTCFSAGSSTRSSWLTAPSDSSEFELPGKKRIPFLACRAFSALARAGWYDNIFMSLFFFFFFSKSYRFHCICFFMFFSCKSVLTQ